MELLLIPVVLIGGALFICYSEKKRKEKLQEELEYEERMKTAREAMRPPSLTKIEPVGSKDTLDSRAERRNDDYHHENDGMMDSFAAGMAGAALGNALFGRSEAGETRVDTGGEYSGGGSSGSWSEDNSGDSGSSWGDSRSTDSGSSWGSDWSSGGGFDGGFGGGDW